MTQKYGADTWDALLASAGLDGAYTSLGNYPDEHLAKLVGAASAALQLPANDVVRWVGQEAMPLLVKKYPGFFAKHQATRPFIMTINGIIHPEVKKLYPGADTPDFALDATSPEVLVMKYFSKRRLCAFAEGLITGAALHFGETVSIRHCTCMHRGDDHCRLELSFSRRAESNAA